MSSWYGQSSTKQQIQTLIQKKPSLAELFTVDQFCQEMKSFNPKLLDYFSNNPELIKQAIIYLTVSPSITDSHQRKHKLPLLSVEMIQTETTCVLNSFFKETKEESRTTYFDQLFNFLNSNEVLPLLAGYFFRVNLCMMNTRFKETFEQVYNNPTWMHKLLLHCEHMPIANTLQLYLNLDANKTVSQINPRERINIKMDLLGKVIARIGNESRLKNNNSLAIIDNLTGILIQTIEKYYLIGDGKEMMEVITSQTCVDVMLGLLRESSQLAYPAMNFFIALINYYSFSSLNSEQKHNMELYLKNLQRLENQPMIVGINNFFAPAMEKIMKSDKMTLHQYRIMQVLCHMISISSKKVLSTIRQIRFFHSLITLLFKYQNSNIMHMLIEKSFLHIFISERPIYDQYKKHLFCELDIIQITATRFLQKFPDDKTLSIARKKGYFGHFLRILKIYSGVQTTDQEIVTSIKAKSEVWNKISKLLIKPYESICYKDLGSYNDVPEPSALEFTIKKNIGESTQPQNSNAIQEIKREEEIQNIKTMESSSESKRQEEGSTSPFNASGDKFAQELFKSAVNNFMGPTPNLLKSESHQNSSQKQETIQPESPKQLQVKRSESFQQYMVKKKVEASHQIRMQRSLSTEKRLSGNKVKLVSPSPQKIQKVNSWKQKDQTPSSRNQKKTNNSVSQFGTGNSPQRDKNSRSSHSGNKKSLNQSTLVERGNHHLSDTNNENSTQFRSRTTQSMVNLQDIKKIRVIQIEKPTEKKYRRMEDKDKLLLDFLGIAY